MPDRSERATESANHRQHDHAERGHETAREQTQAHAGPEGEIAQPTMMGGTPSGILSGDGGVSLQRSHAKMLSEAGLNRSLNAQRRINMYLQLQRNYGNSHVQQVQRLIKEHSHTGEEAEHGAGAGNVVDTADVAEGAEEVAQDVQSKAVEETAGRAQVSRKQGVALQRVPIKDAPTPETLLEKKDPPAATPATPGTTPATPPPAPPPPAYEAKPYTGQAAYDMTRLGDSVSVKVRILFLSPPTDTDASGNMLPDNDPKRSGGEIPSGDARRTEALNLVGGNTAHTGGTGTGSKGGITSVWNNKAELVGKKKAAPGTGAGSHSDAGPNPAPATEGPDIVLPIKFSAEAVFSPSQDHDQRVFLHAATDVADPNRADPSRNLRPATPPTPPPPGTPAPPAPKPRMSVIDAGNWYTARPQGNYGFKKDGDPDNFPLDLIYAHEYGHYLGIPDEYSRSNPAMHLIMHGVTPNQADRDKMDKQIDAASSEEIILAAMMPQLQSHMNAISKAMLDAIKDQKKVILRRMSAALRTGWHNKTVLNTITTQVNSHLDAVAAVPATPAAGTTPASPGSAALPEQKKAKKASHEAVVFEATKNLSYLTNAQKAIDLVLRLGAADKWINGIMTGALEGAMGKVTNNHVHQIGAGVPELPAGGVGMRVDTIGVPGTSASLDTASGNAARTLVGAAPAGTTPPRVAPSGSLLAAIAKLPAAWKGMSTMFNGADIEKLIPTLASANLEKGGFRGAVADSPRKLYKELYTRFNDVCESASYNALSRFMSGQVQPLIESQLQELLTAIRAEAASPGTATPTGTSTSRGGTPDPAIAARAAAIKTAVTTMSTEAKKIQDTPETTTDASGKTTNNDMHVRMTMNTTMGSQYDGTDVRPNYMESIVRNFNARRDPAVLKHEDETDFTARRIAAGPATTP